MLAYSGLLLAISLPIVSFQVGSSPSGATEAPPSNIAVYSGTGWGQEIEKIPPLALPDGRLLVTAGDKIHMVAPDGKLMWRFSPEVPLTAQPAYRSDRNEIALVGFDLTYQWLNANTGEVLWRASVGGGRSTFADVKPFDSAYLVLVSMEGYRHPERGYPGAIPLRESSDIPDKLRYWARIETENWSTDFPVDAQLMVAGKHIYAVKHEKDSVTIQEIFRPDAKK